jgi:DNA-binding XRE family transcriptional regulator|tara:strand:- start:4148 stop:4396 length:249 start_codon:yes stop_codon:yes gene_type:complete
MATKTKRRRSYKQWLKAHGQLLAEYRDRAQVTNEQIATRCNVSRWTASRLMTGRYAGNPRHLFEMSLLFDCEVGALMPPVWP